MMAEILLRQSPMISPEEAKLNERARCLMIVRFWLNFALPREAAGLITPDAEMELLHAIANDGVTDSGELEVSRLQAAENISFAHRWAKS